jgi:hypothetical protein
MNYDGMWGAPMKIEEIITNNAAIIESKKRAKLLSHEALSFTNADRIARLFIINVREMPTFRLDCYQLMQSLNTNITLLMTYYSL